MNPARFGPLVGAIGGLVFMLVNAGALTGAAPLLVRCLGAAAFALVIWFVSFRASGLQAPAALPTRRELLVYWACVGAMVVAIPLGAQAVDTVLGSPELTVCWVVLVVGAHFLPFAKAFDVPVFTPLAWTLIGLAAAGGALTFTVTGRAAPWTGVLAGAVLLFFSAFGAHTGGRLRAGRSA